MTDDELMELALTGVDRGPGRTVTDDELMELMTDDWR